MRSRKSDETLRSMRKIYCRSGIALPELLEPARTEAIKFALANDVPIDRIVVAMALRRSFVVAVRDEMEKA